MVKSVRRSHILCAQTVGMRPAERDVALLDSVGDYLQDVGRDPLLYRWKNAVFISVGVLGIEPTRSVQVSRRRLTQLRVVTAR